MKKYSKILQSDRQSSMRSEADSSKDLSSKLLDDDQKSQLSNFINLRKQMSEIKVSKEARMQKIKNAYGHSQSMKKLPSDPSSKKTTFTQQLSKAFKEERDKKKVNNEKIDKALSKKGVNLEDMYYQKSQVVVGKSIVDTLEIQQLGNLRHNISFKPKKSKSIKHKDSLNELKMKESQKPPIKKYNQFDYRQNEEKKNKLLFSRQLLQGKLSIVWIFVLQQIPSYCKDRIVEMYDGLSDEEYMVPLCRTVEQAKVFLQIPNCWFKIISDLDSIKEAIKFRLNKKVIQFYIYNDKGEAGISQSLKYKTQVRKVKGIYSQLDKVLDRAEDEIESQIHLFHLNNGITTNKHAKKFPSFLRLSGTDKTDATNYRTNLYGAMNLPEKEKVFYFEQFLRVVIQRYRNKQPQQIKDYQGIDHSKKITSLDQARLILQFYSRQSFYYQLLNTMLRTVKTTEEFSPCILPFNETYHSIKQFYNHEMEQNKRKIHKKTVYRGTKMKKKDFRLLKKGVFIEMFGFMSTSKSLEKAATFTDESKYVFVIHIPEMIIPKKFEFYDHGFVDMNQYTLSEKKFSIEEQVLFNALNVYKVRQIQSRFIREEPYTLIHLEYGVMFELLGKKKLQLSDDQLDVLLNYQYSMNMMKQIEDQGDVFLHFQQFDESKNYYEEKIKHQQNLGKYYYKLANVQQECGELEQAENNVQKSLEIQLQNIDHNDREMCLKVFSIHSKNAEICLEKEDYLYADDSLSDAIDLLGEEDMFEKGRKLRERGEIKFKKGEIINAEKDFQKSERILNELTSKGEKKKKEINKNYFFSFLTFVCSSQSREEIQADKEQKLKQIEMLEIQIANMKQNINDELIKVNRSMKDVAEYVEDKQKYEIYVKKARSYLLQVQSRRTNDPLEKARLKAMEATIQDYLELAESEKLLSQAIQLVEASDPYNESVGKYSSILANLQKQDLQKFSNPKCMMKAKLSKQSEPIPYNEKQHKQVYQKCRKNYEKAITVLMYHNKVQDSPDLMNLKNQLGQLDYNENNFQESYKIIKEARDKAKNCEHSEVSKACLLLSKIAFARGELKNSFDNIQEAKGILHKAIVKKEEEKYYEIYHKSDIYLQIKLHRARIYLRQLNHDLSLKDLQQIQKHLNQKLEEQQFHSLLADAYELQGQNMGTSKKMYDFDEYFSKAIKLREKQIGIYNIANAVAYCNYAKYLIVYKDLEGAQKALQKAVEIFSCFSKDHPITWLVLYCYGILKSARNQSEQSLKDLQNCLDLALKKYDKSHITINKLRLQYAKQLYKIGKVNEALREFQSLEDDLEENIRSSHSRYPIKYETDDQKITVKKLLYTSLQSFYRQTDSQTSKESKIQSPTRIQTKITHLKKTYNIKADDL